MFSQCVLQAFSDSEFPSALRVLPGCSSVCFGFSQSVLSVCSECVLGVPRVLPIGCIDHAIVTAVATSGL